MTNEMTETAAVDTEGMDPVGPTPEPLGRGASVYNAGFRYVILGKRGRVAHRITKSGKTACNGTVVNVFNDHVFTTRGEAGRESGYSFCLREDMGYTGGR